MSEVLELPQSEAPEVLGLAVRWLSVEGSQRLHGFVFRVSGSQRVPIIIEGIFLNSGVLESLGLRV